MQNYQNFKNPAFFAIYQGITAALNVYFIPLPIYISAPAAIAIQFGRFAVVFMDFLNPTGSRSPWPPIIATGATILALTELSFSIEHLNYTAAHYWSLFLFGGMLILIGYLLELNFIAKGAEAFGMTHKAKPQIQPTNGQHYTKREPAGN